ncbi:MAG: GNAT family N-acetyltransferase [Conexivisphaerales archaeon]|jgi:ribosomal protein S18 acetylase RimI-like enzyme
MVISDRIEFDLALYPRTCLVASNGRGLMGFSLTEVTGSYASIFLLVVNPERRRRGVGSALVADTLNRLADEGVEYVELMTSLENESAQSFWMRQGFKDAKMKVLSKVSRRRDTRRKTQAFKLEEEAKAKGR